MATRRKNKLQDPKIRGRLLESLRAGAAILHACKYAGIEPSTFYRTIARAETNPKAREFADAVSSAEGEGVLQCLAVIRRAAIQDGTWQAAAWLLERRYPQLYGRTVVEQQDGGKAPSLTEEQRVEKLLKVVGGREP